MKPKNEVTSASVSKLAGSILSNTKGIPQGYVVVAMDPNVMFALADMAAVWKQYKALTRICEVGELSKTAASCLTQTPNKPEKAKK